MSRPIQFGVGKWVWFDVVPCLGVACLQRLLCLIVWIHILSASLIRISGVFRSHTKSLSVLLSKGVRSFLLELVHPGRHIAAIRGLKQQNKCQNSQK